MGALCGKESSNDPFSQPGRTLGSAPPAQTTSSLPASRKVGGPPRTLGGGSGAASQGDVQANVAKAAVERSNAQQPKGDLGRKVLANKKMTPTQHLVAASQNDQKHGLIDQTTKNLYNE